MHVVGVSYLFCLWPWCYDGVMMYSNFTLVYIVVRHPNMLHLFVEFAYTLYPITLLLSQHYFMFWYKIGIATFHLLFIWIIDASM